MKIDLASPIRPLADSVAPLHLVLELRRAERRRVVVAKPKAEKRREVRA